MKMRFDPKKPRRGRTDWTRIDSLTDRQIKSAARRDPDSRPLTARELSSMKRPPDVKALRTKLGMTQAAFADAFQLSIATVRDWEQGRFAPDRAARVLLRLIQAIPDEVLSVLAQSRV